MEAVDRRFFLFVLRGPPGSTLFPYTTLFRSGFALATRQREAHDRACTDRARRPDAAAVCSDRSEEHTSELQSLAYLVCRLLLEKKKAKVGLFPNIGQYRTQQHTPELQPQFHT